MPCIMWEQTEKKRVITCLFHNLILHCAPHSLKLTYIEKSITTALSGKNILKVSNTAKFGAVKCECETITLGYVQYCIPLSLMGTKNCSRAQKFTNLHTLLILPTFTFLFQSISFKIWPSVIQRGLFNRSKMVLQTLMSYLLFEQSVYR